MSEFNNLYMGKPASYWAELEAENQRLREALETIAKEEDTLGWVYAARIAKAALQEGE
jgi:hypothetical protein